MKNGLDQSGTSSRRYNQVNFDEVRSTFSFHRDSLAKAAFVYDSINEIFAPFDDHKSIQLRSQYELNNNLGGIMFWQLM